MKAGGYLESKNILTHTTRNISYDKTEISRTLYYIYDVDPPRHCSRYRKCNTEPLKLSTRLTRSKKLTVTFDDWVDPNPSSDHTDLASGIKSYEINIYEVTDSTTADQMRNTTSLKVYKLPDNVTTTEIDLPETNMSMLYAVLLEVTDHANNVRQARRFVLYDNSSVIVKNSDIPFRVESASNKTDFKWQVTHGELCFSWKNRFFNNHYITNNPFRPIKPEGHNAIHGKYEQISGLIPVSGTQNVNGLNEFYYSLEKNDKEIVLNGKVFNFTSETICLVTNMIDGDVFKFNIQARDIMNHTLNDSVTVNIDGSVPQITDMWLVRDGNKQLYVHHDTDLSLMSFQFKAFDKHSAIKEMKWAFGVYENKTVLIKKGVGVTRIDASVCIDSVFLINCDVRRNILFYINYLIMMIKQLAN